MQKDEAAKHGVSPCREEVADEKLPVWCVASVKRLPCGVLLCEFSFEVTARVSMTILA